MVAEGPPQLPASWRVSQAYPEGVNLFALSCPTRSLCVATGSSEGSKPETGGSSGILATSTSPGTPSWSFQSASWGPRSVECASNGFCGAASAQEPIEGVFTTTNPAGGVESWTPSVQVPGSADGLELEVEDCPAPGFCLVRVQGRGLFSLEGSTFSLSLAAFRPTSYLGGGATCPSAESCLAVFGGTTGSDGATWVGTRRRGQPVRWTKVGPGPPGASGPACPAVSLCVVSSVGGTSTLINARPGATWTSDRWFPEASTCSADRLCSLWKPVCPSVGACFGFGNTERTLPDRTLWTGAYVMAAVPAIRLKVGPVSLRRITRPLIVRVSGLKPRTKLWLRVKVGRGTVVSRSLMADGAGARLFRVAIPTDVYGRPVRTALRRANVTMEVSGSRIDGELDTATVQLLRRGRPVLGVS